MAKTLAIKIKVSSTGEEKVIKNINELEQSIEQLNDELKGLDFGTEEYKRTAKELQNLRSSLKEVERETEGLDVEQRLSALGGALDTVSGGFLLASSAARTFGGDAETVEEIERLEQQALEAVNIALGIRQFSEGLVQASMLKRVIAEKAANLQTKIATGLQTLYTAAVGTSTGALKLFRLALIGTGIGAIIVLIGELIANWDKLTGSINQSTDANEDFKKVQVEAQKTTAKSLKELTFYSNIVNDVTKSEYERQEALKELNKLGVITDDITLDNVDSLDKLNERLELARENILLKAEADAAASLLSESLKEQIETQNTTIEENITLYDRVKNSVLSFGNVYTTTSKNIEDGLENQQNAINETTSDVERYEKIYLGILERLNQSEGKLREEREKSNKVLEEKNRRTREAAEIDKRAAEVIRTYADRINELSDSIGNLNTEAEASAEILDKTQKVIDQQNELLGKRDEFFKDETAELIKEFENLIGLTLIPKDVEKATKDQFFEIFNTFRDVQKSLRDSEPIEISTELSDDGDLFTIEKRVETIGDATFTSFTRINDITGETTKTFKRLSSVTDEYGNVTMRLTDETEDISVFNRELLDSLLGQVDAEKLKLEVGEDVFQSLIDITSVNETINEQLNEYNKSLQDSRDEIEVQVDKSVDYNELQEDLLQLQEDLTFEGKNEAEIQDEINKTISERLFDTENLNSLSEKQNEIVDLTNKTLLSRKSTLVDFNKLTDMYIELSEYGNEVNLSTNELNDLRLDNLTKELFGVNKLSDLNEEQRKIVISVNDELLKQVGYYEDVLSVNDKFNSLSEQILENLQKQSEELTGEEFDRLVNFIRQTASGFETLEELEPFQGLLNELKQLNEFRDTFNDLKKDLESFEDVEQLVSFIDGLSLSSAKLLGLTEEQLKQLKLVAKENSSELKTFIENLSFDLVNLTEEQIELLQQLFDDLKLDRVIDKIKDFGQLLLQEFQNISNGIQNILSNQLSLELERLEYYERTVLQEIGDETDRQRELQEEFRTDIAEQRFELNKKGRIQELKFQVASSIASGAQSVVNALSTPIPPPGPQILAGVYAALSAKEISTIRSQLRFVESTQFIARRGGLVSGPSHENGGVMANGGSLILEGGEAIINRNAASEFSDILSQINISTGGRSLEMDDSSLVQEIRKQNQRPIKTYVLYEDIQNTNKINSRLEQLSRL